MKLHEFNPATDRPLLHLAHANGFPPEVYARMLTPLFEHYRVISFCARPLWDSPPPPESLTEWSQLADDLLDSLKDLGASQVIGIGHSMGATATMYAAVKRPKLFHRLIYLDPVFLPPSRLWLLRTARLLGLEQRTPLVRAALRRKRSWSSAAAAYDYLKSKPLFKDWPDDVFRAYVDNVLCVTSDGGVALKYTPEWEARIFQTTPTDVWNYVGLPQQPTLILRGEHSNTFTYESERVFERTSPRAELVTVKGTGHLLAQEKPDEVGKLIVEFLKEA